MGREGLSGSQGDLAVGHASVHEGCAAWVVFSGKTELKWLRVVLRAGFRHCFLLLHDGRRWLSFDPLAHYTDIHIPDVPGDFDLPGWLAGQGFVCMPAPLRRDLNRPAPWMPFTCVEAVKRVIGLHARRIVTPWQLYRYLRGLSLSQQS